MRIPQKRRRTALRARRLTCSVFRSLDCAHASRCVCARRCCTALDVKIFHLGNTCSFRRTDHRAHDARTRIRLTLHVSLVLSARLASDEQPSRSRFPSTQLVQWWHGAERHYVCISRAESVRRRVTRCRDESNYTREFHHACASYRVHRNDERTDLTKAVLKRDIARCGQSGSASHRTLNHRKPSLRMLRTVGHGPIHRDPSARTSSCRACFSQAFVTRVDVESDVAATNALRFVADRAALDRVSKCSSWWSDRSSRNRGQTVTFSRAAPFSNDNDVTAAGAPEPQRSTAAGTLEYQRFSCATRCLVQPS